MTIDYSEGHYDFIISSLTSVPIIMRNNKTLDVGVVDLLVNWKTDTAVDHPTEWEARLLKIDDTDKDNPQVYHLWIKVIGNHCVDWKIKKDD